MVEGLAGATAPELVTKVDLKWIKLIGGGILTVLVLPWIRDLAVAVFN